MKEICECNICGGVIKSVYKLRNRELIGMAEEYVQDISMCANCGFIFTRNPFDEQKLSNRYKNFSKFEFDDQNYILDEAQDYKVKCKRQKQFIDRVAGLHNIKSVLEIGAASGYNLSLYRDTAQVYGVEPSVNNCRSAEKKYGFSMYCGVFDEFCKDRNQEKQYDMIFLSHTLEHIVNPCDFIMKCAEFNKKYFFIEVPTFDYKFSNEPFGMFCEEHVNLFTLEGLQSLMNKCGYQLVDADFILSIEQKLPAGFPSMATLWEKGFRKSYKIINRSDDILLKYIEDSERELERIRGIIDGIDDNKRLAVWGTGHHVSMLLANTDLSSKNIVRVYDSDIRKHGMLFCGVSIEAFSESDIKDNEIDIILLATYTAQNALEKILSIYEKQIEVVKLYSL